MSRADTSRRYTAFLSYSHADTALAERLHKALEAYRPPRHLRDEGRSTLAPVFRDAAELGAAASLPDTIREALSRSDHLIVLASPEAGASPWVNAEIRTFREMHGNERILCASPTGRVADFPPALLETGVEPLAADVSREGFRTGVLQLASAMLGTGLDELVQRDLRKLRRRVTAITVSSLAIVSMMGVLTWMAMSARGLAEQRRQDAEGQVEFMITDLKDELEAIGRLGPLDAVGERAADYYARYPLASHDADALGRRARVFHMLGEVNDLQGEFATAGDYFLQAHAATEALLAQTPDDPDRVFEHAQSAFWVGYILYKRKDLAGAARYLQAYADLAERLGSLEGPTERVEEERLYALANLGMVATAAGRREHAQDILDRLVEVKVRRSAARPDDLDARLSAVNSLYELAGLRVDMGGLPAAAGALEQALELLDEHEGGRDDFRWVAHRLTGWRSLASTHLMTGDVDAADDVLDMARRDAETLHNIEPGSIEVAIELLKLDMVDFSIAYLREDSAAAEAIHRTFTDKLDAIDVETAADSRLAAIAGTASAYPLFLSVLSGESGSAREEAQHLLSRQGRGDTGLAPRLLAHAVLSTRPDDVPDCASGALDHSERVALSIFDPSSGCGDVNATDIHTLFRTAMRRLSSHSETLTAGD